MLAKEPVPVSDWELDPAWVPDLAEDSVAAHTASAAASCLQPSLKKVRPKYTAEALRQEIQGSVMLEVVVGRDGTPLAVRVTRSLDPGGLDEEAITAVREWRFTPGRVGETPVDVLVTIVLDFRIY